MPCAAMPRVARTGAAMEGGTRAALRHEGGDGTASTGPTASTGTGHDGWSTWPSASRPQAPATA